MAKTWFITGASKGFGGNGRRPPSGGVTMSRRRRAESTRSRSLSTRTARIFFGKTPLAVATRDYESRLATWNEWQPVSVEAAG